LINCIDKIYDSETIYPIENYNKDEILEFIDGLSPSMIKSISSFFENMPKIIFEKEYISPFTSNKINIKVENFMDFLI